MQTLEGGAQLYLSQPGFAKVLAVGQQSLATSLEQSVCVARQTVSLTDVCYTNQGQCTPGCAFTVTPTSIQFSVANPQTINVRVTATVSGSVPIDDAIAGSCTMVLTIGSLVTDADVGITIDPTTGAFSAALDRINSAQVTNVNWSGCGMIGNLASLVTSLNDAFLASWVVDFFTPALNATITTIVPDPRELAAMVNLPALVVTGPAASTGALVETRLLPGGYSQLTNGGLALGMITGFNADADPATRTAGLVSEAAPCAAGLTPPDFAAPAYALTPTARGTFPLAPAGPFVGAPAPASDFVLGVSKTALDLAGYHMVAAGGLCLTMDAGRLAVIGRDMLDDLLGVPLDTEAAELRLVVRPQDGMRFAIPVASAGAPTLIVALLGLRIDLEAKPATTFIPVLSLTADVELGLLFGTRRDAGLPVMLEATRATLSVSNPSVLVSDPRYAGLSAAERAQLVGTAVDVVWSGLGAGAGVFFVPGVGGMSADNVGLARTVTPSDEFLTITASLVSGTAALSAPAPTPAPTSSTLTVPTPTELRAALLAGDDSGLPTVHIELPTSDDASRPLEHAWRTAGGAWRPYQAVGDLVVRDRSFAWQGPHTIELRSRVVGDDGTTSPTGTTAVLIDYAPPTIFAAQATLTGALVVPARDTVSTTLEWAMARLGANTPTTAWTADPNLNRAEALSLGNDIVVFVRDNVGNVAQATVHLADPNPAGQQPSTGCGCAAGLGSQPPTVLLLMLAWLVAARRSRGVSRRSGRSSTTRPAFFWSASGNDVP